MTSAFPQPARMERSIVVIDDDAVIRRLVARILETTSNTGDPAFRTCYRVHTYGGGEAGLRAMDNLSVDAVVCDFVMPGMSGLEVVCAIRQHRRHAEVPILVLSGRGSTADIEAAVAAGADRYMTKPFSSVDLQEMVASILDAPSHAARAGVPIVNQE